MVGGFSAAEFIVVHGREIIVDEGISMDHLQGGGDRHHSVLGGPDRLTSGKREDGPKTLPSRPNAVLHGLVEAGWPILDLGKISLKGGFHRFLSFLKIFF
jgi:hypothetical protein